MHKARALVIEDDAVDQMAFSRFVSEGRFPWEYTIAGSVSEAKEILASDVFDIIIADYIQHEAAITAYERRRKQDAPWLFTDIR